MANRDLEVGTAQGTPNWHLILEDNLAKLNDIIEAPLTYEFSGGVATLGVTLSSPYGSGTGPATLATSGTEYVTALGIAPPDATEADVQIIVPFTGAITNLRAFLGTAPGTGDARVFTLRVNGADTADVVTISGANTTGVDSAHSVSVTAGDRVTIKSTVTGTPDASVAAFAFELQH